MILTHYNLFISSTFKDMDVERDVIKFEVIPALNMLFNPRGVEIHAIDLRYGINTSGLTEAEAADKVLNTCIQSIDRARPFFIGFIGNRYGWIPPEERWLDFYQHLTESQQQILTHSNGLSVTELEILYSDFFSDRSQSNRYIFCLRDEIPTTYRTFLESESLEMQSKCQSLRSKIEKRCADVEYGTCMHYRLAVDNESELYAPDLATRLIQRLSEYIETELETNIATPGNIPLWAKEVNEVSAHFMNLVEFSIGRPDTEHAIEQFGSNVLITGLSFCGKSTLLARLYWKYFREDWENQENTHRKILLTAHVNSSQFSRNIHQIMGKWVVELSMLLQWNYDDATKDAFLIADPQNHKVIHDLFFEAIDFIRSVGHSIHIFIDDLDQFLFSSPGDEKLDWLDDRFTVYATANVKSLQVSDIMGLHCNIISVMDVIEDPYHTLLNAIKRQNFCELPDEICQRLAGDNKKYLLDHYMDQPEYICQHLGKTEYTFLQLNTIFKMVQLLNKEDFRQMRQMDQLETSSIMKMFDSLPQDENNLLDHFVRFYTDRVGSRSKYTQLISLLRDHPEGLAVNDIIDSMTEPISAPEVYHMLYYFHDFVSIESDTSIVKLRYHKDKYGSYLRHLQNQRIVSEIQKEANLYRITEAMQLACNLANVQMPMTLADTVRLNNQFPELFNSINLTSFVINAYQLNLYQQSDEDIMKACIHVGKAIHIAEQMGEDMDVCKGHIYWTIASMWKNEGNYKQARIDGAKAIDIFEKKHALFSDLPELYAMVGGLYERDECYAQAVRYYIPALKIMKMAQSCKPQYIKMMEQHILDIQNLMSNK